MEYFLKKKTFLVWVTSVWLIVRRKSNRIVISDVIFVKLLLEMVEAIFFSSSTRKLIKSEFLNIDFENFHRKKKFILDLPSSIQDFNKKKIVAIFSSLANKGKLPPKQPHDCRIFDHLPILTPKTKIKISYKGRTLSFCTNQSSFLKSESWVTFVWIVWGHYFNFFFSLRNLKLQ